METIPKFNIKDNPITAFIFAIGLSTLFFFVSIFSGYELIFLGISSILFFTYLIVANPKYWIYSIILTSPLYLISNESDFDLSDAISGVLWIGGLSIWFFFYILIKRKKIVDDVSDWLFLLFYFCLILNSIIGYMNENDMEFYFRTVARFTIPLLYFPIKEHFRTREDLIKLLKILLIAFMILAIWMLYETSTRLQYIQSAWEVGGILRLNQSLFGVSIIVIISMIIYNKRIKNKLIITLFLIPYLTVFISSLSRIFWIGLIISLFFAVFFIDKKQRKIIILSFLIFLFLSLVIGVTLLGDKAELFLSVFEKRFTSIFNFMEDESFLVRFQEYGVAFNDIFRYPFMGNGFAHKIMYYNKLESVTWFTANVHNGFVIFLLRFGFPLTIIYYSVFSYKFFKSMNYVSKSRYTLEKMVLLGVGSGFVLIFISNFLTAAVISRDGDFLNALMFALISITTRLIDKDAT